MTRVPGPRRLWFVIPAHGRLELTRICLRQLRRTCDELTAREVEASAVVIACDENLETARGVGFATVERNNRFLSRRFNDGIQLALDERYNPRPADHVVPCGSDDWLDFRLLLRPPPRHSVLAFQKIAFVREDGQELSTATVDYRGGAGIRVYSRETMAAVGFRPADEDRTRACDTSILVNLTRHYDRELQRKLRVFYGDLHDLQIVDWKSAGQQINGYTELRHYARGRASDPFELLQGCYPAEALDEMRAHYAGLELEAVVA